MIYVCTYNDNYFNPSFVEMCVFAFHDIQQAVDAWTLSLDFMKMGNLVIKDSTDCAWTINPLYGFWVNPFLKPTREAILTYWVKYASHWPMYPAHLCDQWMMNNPIHTLFPPGVGATCEDFEKMKKDAQSIMTPNPFEFEDELDFGTEECSVTSLETATKFNTLTGKF